MHLWKCPVDQARFNMNELFVSSFNDTIARYILGRGHTFNSSYVTEFITSDNFRSENLRQCQSAKICYSLSVHLRLATDVPGVTYTPGQKEKCCLKRQDLIGQTLQSSSICVWSHITKLWVCRESLCCCCCCCWAWTQFTLNLLPGSLHWQHYAKAVK